TKLGKKHSGEIQRYLNYADVRPPPPPARGRSIRAVKARTAVIVLAVAAVLIAIVIGASGGGSKGKGGGGSATKPSSDAIRVSFVYSPEKQKLLAPLIEKFNSERHGSDGKPVFVDAQVVASGDAETKIAKRQLQPVLWSPAS